MSTEEQVRKAVQKALDDNRAEMTNGLMIAIIAEVVKSFTPTRDPGHGHGTNN